jgi:hypothetical protein
VRTDRSWKRKNIPGLRCSSSRRYPFEDSGPTRVRVYALRGLGAGSSVDVPCAKPVPLALLLLLLLLLFDAGAAGGGKYDDDTCCGGWEYGDDAPPPP